MRLNSKQLQQIHDALLDSFDMGSLQIMVRVQLGENLSFIASGGNLSDVIFGLIEWAERTNRLMELLAGAARHNPTNRLINQSYSDALSSILQSQINNPSQSISHYPLVQIINNSLDHSSTKLDLSKQGLSVLPDELFSLVELTELDLSGNQLDSLSDRIGQLINLQVLNLSGNRLRQLPETFSLLNGLNSLNLSQNQFTEVPLPITAMRSLSSVDVSENQLFRMPEELFRMTSLHVLNLRNNQIAALSPSIRKLSNLQSLDLSGNQLSSIPSQISQLFLLRELNLSNNHLQILPKEFAPLALKELDLSQNQLAEFPEPILRLSSLTYLNLADNRLTKLPLAIRQLRRLDEINLERNPFAQSVETLASTKDPQRIFAFLEAQAKGQKHPLNEAKLLIVGEASVGKTSLVNLLTNQPFNKEEETTREIHIEPWEVRYTERTIKVNIWDFGGQDIMHATHQFFLTKRSVYVLVLDSRAGEKASRLEYWLKLIRSYAGDSPLLVVCNKSDQNRIALNWSYLKEKYGIAHFVRECCCITGNGIAELREVLANVIEGLKHVNEPIPENWFAVKSCIENLQSDFLPYDTYQKIASENGIDDKITQDLLLQYLHDLGVVLWFGDDPRLVETNVINPRWLTRAVYTIINSKALYDQHGKFEIRQLREILGSATYRSKIPFVVDVMKRFELCFSIDCLVGECILVPGLLAVEEPDIGKWEDTLRFEVHYEVLPTSVISRFIARMHHFAFNNTFWRTGIVLVKDDTLARIRAEETESRITIEVHGPLNERRRLLEVIRSAMRIIHSTLPDIAPTEWVPIPGRNAAASYEQLLSNERFGIERFVPQGMDQPVVVRELLEGVDPPEKRSSGITIQPRRFTKPIPQKLLSLIDDLVDVLLRLPPTMTFEGRTSLLFGIPGAESLNRSSNSSRTDLTIVFDQLWNREMILTASHPLARVISNAVPYTGGADTSSGQVLLALHNKIELVYREL